MDTPNCDGSRSYESIYSRSGQFPRDREVHHNAAYDSTHDYEELPSVGVESKEQGPRRKDNDLYEPTGPLKQRVRQITECSDDLSALSVCSASGFPSWKKDSCLSKLILFLILAFSVAALVLVILIIYGTLGPKCGCKDFNTGTKPDTPRPAMQSSVQSLLSRIEALENEMSTMKSKMEAKDNALENFVTRHESQVEVLQNQVNKTATKVSTVDGVWVKMHSSHEAFEKKLDSEFKQLNESVNKLNTRISSDVKELRKNQVITERMSERLAINVTNVESSVRELRKTNENISSRVASLERGYTRMNNTMRTLQAIDTAQNASRQRLHSLHKRLRASLTAVNATLNDKIKKMDAISDKQQGVNFSLCEHKTVSSTKVSADKTSGESDAFYYFSKDKRVMGVTCATNNARFYTLSEFTSSQGKGFKCKCEQLSPVFYKELIGRKQVSMQCYLHVWECPI